MSYYVYLLARKPNGTLYIGVTGDLAQRVYKHREGRGSSFTSKYGVCRLVYYETFNWIDDAIAWEKELKKWRRQWKISLIQQDNPDWDDLYLTLQN